MAELRQYSTESLESHLERQELKDAILREFAKTEPVSQHFDEREGFSEECPYCEMDCYNSHEHNCLWLRARKLMEVETP